MKKKLTARERREQERKILAEMDAAMSENDSVDESVVKTKRGDAAEKKKTPKYDSSMPEKVHCKRCKTLMENGVCPTCGFKIYVPMDEGKRKKIRLIVATVAVVVFVVLFVILQFKKG